MKSRVFVFVLIVALGAVALAACGGSKSKDQQASDLLNQGLQQHVDGKLDEAAATYREVLKKDPQNKFAFYNLGLIDQTQNKLQSAENNYRLALNIDPDYGPALFNLAIIRTAAGATQDAIDLYRHAIIVTPDPAGAHLNLGLLLRKAGQVPEGDAEVKLAIQLDPTLATRDVPDVPAPPPAATPGAGTTLTPRAAVTPTPAG